MIAPTDLINRAVQLRSDAAAHKAAIWRHRRELRETMGALAAIEAECRRLGIGFRQEQTHATDSAHAAEHHAVGPHPDV